MSELILFLKSSIRYTSAYVNCLWLGMMLGPCVGYILQTMTMVQTGQAEGFSPFVSFILIVSNLIRIFWWYAERFSLVIFFAAIIMILCQLALLFMWVKIMNKPNHHGFRDEEVNLAKIKLGKRRFENFQGARLKKLRGEQLQAPEGPNNHPLKAANNRNWSDSTR